MENIRREKALQRAQARIRGDEKLVLLFGFDQLLVVAGSQTVPRPGGAAALTRLRILLAQEDGSHTYTSLGHSTVLGAQLQTKFLGPSVLTINAGPMGILALVGARRDMKQLADGINLFVGRPDAEQPVSRLVPPPSTDALCCSECGVRQQDTWNPTPDYCHGCLRTFEWPDRQRNLVAEFRAYLDAGAKRSELPAHLWEWTKKENPDFARKLRG
ncbi:hypothetical protein ACFV2X_38400 [Streptomyces sp. NPDC059679]|uniref:hypothetical protein n=1 Tax=Streptomyces sp. NPDC059679 TaxID=3346903 RepID=UPI00369CD1C2